MATAEKQAEGLEYKIYSNEELSLCDEVAILEEMNVGHHIMMLSDPPSIELPKKKLDIAYGKGGEFISMKKDFLAALTMQEFLSGKLVGGGQFSEYEVCDVGFWDLDISTDTGFSWHNDHNWNLLLKPDHKSYHGWFVNSCTDDCNSTLAISMEAKYNDCNAHSLVGITDIENDTVINPDVVVPLEQNTLVLFPVGAVHRTYRFKEPTNLVGHRICTSFILHHPDDGLDTEKIASSTDGQLLDLLSRYPIEKHMESGHYMVGLLEAEPSLKPLLKKLEDDLLG